MLDPWLGIKYGVDLPVASLVDSAAAARDVLTGHIPLVPRLVAWGISAGPD
jgi:hypothetical protein